MTPMSSRSSVRTLTTSSVNSGLVAVSLLRPIRATRRFRISLRSIGERPAVSTARRSAAVRLRGHAATSRTASRR